MIYKLNGSLFDVTAEHLIGDVNYPRGWFQDATNRAAMGITEEADPIAPSYVPTEQDIINSLTSALERHYDTTAQTRQYDNRLTCALRAGYAGTFQAEGTAFAIWMDNCNAYAYAVMTDVRAGLRGIPTNEGLIAELPVLIWPVI